MEGKTLVEQLGGAEATVDGKGDQKVSVKELSEYKLVGIYFTGSWCPPCRAFSPHVNAFLNEANKEAKNLKTFWLIDPIDGTSDYIQGRDEFTRNAGLIIENKAELGIINAPAKKRLF